MKGLIHYFFANYFRTYKYVPPVSIFIIILVINYSYTPNPIMSSYSFTSLMLFFIMGWVVITIFHMEDKNQKEITIMHAKSIREYYLALVINCIIVGLLFSILAVAYPIIFNFFSPDLRIAHIVIGFFAHFSLSLLSIALSLFFTREFVKNDINTWWGVISILVISLVLAVANIDILKIKLINWFLPPLRYSLDIMSIDDEVIHLSGQIYREFGWVFIYSLILISIYIAIVQKRRII
ncbi:ABC transporter permease [Lysinibacillus alkalisoli]|nr:ABC transporter permease [Lysinibacillus alkalisoli]